MGSLFLENTFGNFLSCLCSSCCGLKVHLWGEVQEKRNFLENLKWENSWHELQGKVFLFFAKVFQRLQQSIVIIIILLYNEGSKLIQYEAQHTTIICINIPVFYVVSLISLFSYQFFPIARFYFTNNPYDFSSLKRISGQ